MFIVLQPTCSFTSHTEVSKAKNKLFSHLVTDEHSHSKKKKNLAKTQIQNDQNKVFLTFIFLSLFLFVLLCPFYQSSFHSQTRLINPTFFLLQMGSLYIYNRLKYKVPNSNSYQLINVQKARCKTIQHSISEPSMTASLSISKNI